MGCNEADAALREIEDELANFSRYSMSVARNTVGQARLTWMERSEWADRLAGLARNARTAALPGQRKGSEDA